MNGCDSADPEKIAAEQLVQEKVDAEGNKWRKVYVGGGTHFENWLAQSRELGEVEVEEIDPAGLQCYAEAGERVYRIWVKEQSVAGLDL